MRVSLELTTLRNQQAFLQWLAESLTRPDMAVVTIDFPDADQKANVGAFAEGVEIDEAKHV